MADAADAAAPRLSRKRKALVVLVAALACFQMAVCTMSLFRLWPKEKRTRMPSLYSSFYLRLSPTEFRENFRIPRMLFEFVLDQLTQPREGHPRGFLTFGYEAVF